MKGLVQGFGKRDCYEQHDSNVLATAGARSQRRKPKESKISEISGSEYL